MPSEPGDDDRGRLTAAAAAWRAAPPWPVAIWLALLVGGLVARPPLAPVESRLLSAAWRTWVEAEGPFAFADQPPLPIWLIHLGWAVLGVSETWARLVAPLFALGALLLIAPLARLLWPERPDGAPLAAIVFAGSGVFAAYSSLSVLAWPLVCFALVGLVGIALAGSGRPAPGWALLGAGIGLGFLATASLAPLLLLVPVALLGPVWLERAPDGGWGAWYAGLSGAAALGAAIALAWLLPAAGGDVAAAGDIVLAPPGDPSGAAQPWYGAIVFAPLALYPWLLWQTLWLAGRWQFRRLGEGGSRFCLLAAAAGLAAALTLGEGQAQDLLLPLPALALLAARLLTAADSRPTDFHAVVPGLIALLVGLVFFLLNLVPVAHLDAVWREFIGDSGLPLWLGGISLVSGLTLLGGGYLLAQMTPRELTAGAVQLALMPALLATTLNLEFAVSLRRFFDLEPVARQIHALQQAGRPVGVYGAYGGEFDFPGRLERPLAVLADRGTAVLWAADNETGVVVSYFKGSVLRLPVRPLYLGTVGDSRAALWPAGAVQATDGAVLRPRF